MKGHTQELLCTFLHCVKDHPESKTFDTREMVRVSRGDRVSIFSDFDRGEVEFLRWSILVDFRYFRVKIVTIRRRASIFSRATRFVVVLPPPGRAARFFISAFVATALIWAPWATSGSRTLQELEKPGFQMRPRFQALKAAAHRLS